MVWNEGPCETRSFTFRQHETQSIQKIGSVEIIEENLSSIDPPHDDMVQRTGSVYAGFSRHVVYALNTCFYVNRISEERSINCDAGRVSVACGSAAADPAGARPAGFFRRNPSFFYFVGQTSSIQNS
jgi:hypothetical protein